MPNNIRKAPVNLATGSTEVTIRPGLIDLHYYNRFSSGGNPATSRGNVGNNWKTPLFARVFEKNGKVAVKFAPGRKGKIYKFSRNGDNFSPLRDTRATLALQTVPEQSHKNYRLTEQRGKVTIFDGINGKIKTAIDTNGVVTDYQRDAQTGKIEETRTCINEGIQKVVESKKFEYFSATDFNAGKLKSVTLRRATGTSNPAEGDFVDIRRVELVYYQANFFDIGSTGDLQFVKNQIPDGSNGPGTVWQDEQTQYFRYYTRDTATGFKHGLRYVLSAAEFAGLGEVHDPTTATNPQVASFAGVCFEYDDQRRVSKVQEDGGKLEKTMVYSKNSNTTTDDYNHWYRKAVYTQEDGGSKTVYSNRVGADLLVEDTTIDGGRWIHYKKFNQKGRVVENVNPSAIELPSSSNNFTEPFNESANDLNVQVKPNAGLIEVTTWDDTINRPTLKQVKQGSGGDPINVSQTIYTPRTIGSGVEAQTVHHVEVATTFRSETGDPVSTIYTYDWHGDTLQPSKITTKLPEVPASQNGSDVTQSDTTVVEYDTLGRMTSQTDARGTRTEYQYDPATGAQTQVVRDAGTGKLNITSSSVVDDRGRTIETVGPAFDVNGVSTQTVQWTVYKTEYETWSATGYRTASGDTLVNPVRISRASIDGQFQDSITAVRGAGKESVGKLTADDSFPQSSWVAWSRTTRDANGRMIESRTYHKIPADGEGVYDTNYNRTTYGYDAMGRQNQMVDPVGTITRTVFNRRGQVESTWVGTEDIGATDCDPTGSSGNDMVQLTSNEFDNGQTGLDGNLTETIRYTGSPSSSDQITRNEYDWRNRREVTRTVEPTKGDLISRSVLDNQGRTRFSESLSLDPVSGNETLFARSESRYDDRGRVYQTVRDGVNQETGALTGNSITVDMEYDAGGNLIKQTPAGGADFMIYRYDALGRQYEQENPLGFTGTTEYNDASQVVVQLDELDHPTINVYDGIGRMVKTINAENDESLSEYNRAGRMSYQANGEGDSISLNYDDAGRQTLLVQNLAAGVVGPSNWMTMTDYDLAGRVKSVTDANQLTTYFEYDVQGRQNRVEDPLMQVTRSVYDRAGNLIESVDAKQVSTYHEYDSLGRATKTTDRLTHPTHFRFDRAGRQHEIEDAEGSFTRYRYDEYGRLAETQYPDHATGSVVGDSDYGIVSLEYDSLDRLEHRIDQQGDRVTHRYDAAGRLEGKDYRTRANSPSGAISDSATFTYDDTGRIKTAVTDRYSATNPINVSLGYDLAGRKTSETLTIGGQSYLVGSDYDRASRLKELTYPNGETADRDYDPRGLLSTVSYDGDVIDTRLYDAGGRLEKSTYLNNVVTDYNYFDDGRIKQIATTNNGPQKIGTYAYTYDANGNKTSETISGATAGMNDFGFSTGNSGYDAEDRLVEWNRTDGNQDQAWNLSPVGDWDRFDHENGSKTYEHNAAHETIRAGSAFIDHDAKGNQLELPTGVVSNTIDLTWDFDNRLESADNYEFQYDALGRRVLIRHYDGSSSGSVIETVLVSNDQQLIATYDHGAAASSPTQSFVYGAYIDEPIMTQAGTSRLFYSRNQQYSVTALTGGISGNVVEHYAYDAYGNTIIMDDSGTAITESGYGNPFAFTGRYLHSDLDLMYFRARYYNPQLGQFISRDPLGYVDGMSQYRAYFVPGKVDPDGLQTSPIVYESGRGKFYSADVFNGKVKDGAISIIGVFGWQPDAKTFFDDCGNKKCKKIGFAQSAKRLVSSSYVSLGGYGYRWEHSLNERWFGPSYSPTSMESFEFGEFHMDHGGSETKKFYDKPYKSYPVTGDPTTVSVIGMGDAPTLTTNTVKWAKWEFETCVICLEGDEGISYESIGDDLSQLDQVVTYGCAVWTATYTEDKGLKSVLVSKDQGPGYRFERGVIRDWYHIGAAVGR